MQKFKESDIFRNTLVCSPSFQFTFLNGNYVFYQNQTSDFASGSESLYELNIRREQYGFNKIYPFVIKDSSLNSFNSISTSDFDSSLYGSVLTGSYELTSSISTPEFYGNAQARPRIDALRNTINFYSKLHNSFDFSNFDTQKVLLISIPSIFYGSEIRKGTVKLDFYYTGSLISTLEDANQNGTLIQTYNLRGDTLGTQFGNILYGEGFILLNNSASISNNTDGYWAGTENSSWLGFGTGSKTISKLNYSGTQPVQTITMFCDAQKIDLNYSNNPSFLKSHQNTSASISTSAYKENKNLQVKNVVSGIYPHFSESYEKTSYISEIGIYDENKILIGVAKCATPIRKRLNDSYRFKLSLDF